jgi:hypothetical protein
MFLGNGDKPSSRTYASFDSTQIGAAVGLNDSAVPSAKGWTLVDLPRISFGRTTPALSRGRWFAIAKSPRDHVARRSRTHEPEPVYL